MPAVLVGFANPPADSERWSRLTADSPRYFVEVLQQAGGMAMSYPEAVGILLRLAGNPDFARRDPAHLIRGFHAMAEDPDVRLLRAEYPKLAVICRTWGTAYSSEDLQRIDSTISSYFRLPRATRGLEAFVELETDDPLSFFEGWRVVEPANGVDRIENVQQRRYGEIWVDGAPFTGAMLDEMRDIARVVGINLPITAVLLWENCD